MKRSWYLRMSLILKWDFNGVLGRGWEHVLHVENVNSSGQTEDCIPPDMASAVLLSQAFFTTLPLLHQEVDLFTPSVKIGRAFLAASVNRTQWKWCLMILKARSWKQFGFHLDPFLLRCYPLESGHEVMKELRPCGKVFWLIVWVNI